MKRNLTLSILASSMLLAAPLAAKSIESGWKMYGFSNVIDVASTFSSTPVTTVWGYDTINQKWKVYSPDSSLSAIIDSRSDLEQLYTINLGDGVWINATASFELNDGSTSGSATDLQRSLASVVASSASSLGATGEIAGGTTAGVSSSVSSLSMITDSSTSMGRTLASSIPAFTIQNGDFAAIIPSVIDNKDALATMSFFAGDIKLDAAEVTDYTGGAYGLDSSGLPMVMTTLGSFSTAQSTEYQALIGNLITQVATMQSKPLFKYVGETDLQSFFDNLPKTEQEATTLLLSGGATTIESSASTIMAKYLGDTAIAPLIDFSQFSTHMSVEINETINVGGYQVTLPPLVSDSTLDNFMDQTAPLQIIFKGDGNGSVSATDMQMTMSNIDMNVTFNGTTTDIVGKYDLTINAQDGNTYYASPTFNMYGCLGADVYKNGETVPVARMKVFADGLYIVDENNNPIEKVIF